MIVRLEALQNTTRSKKKRKLLGRGPGSGLGKTSGRGHKGMGARSGYTTRQGKEGGGVPLHRRVPTRGFSNAAFSKKFDVINLDQIEMIYQDGETVSLESLSSKGYLKGTSHGIKILGKGTLTKKLSFKVEKVSEGAKKKLVEAGISI